MKLIKLSLDDPDIFNVQISAERCEFLVKNFEAFMQMYRSQGQTFWLRFLMSFKHFTENKLCHSKQWLADILQQFHVIRVLNYIYINIHKKFIEGSNTSAKKLINNLMTLALNSPLYMNCSCEQWLLYIKSAKELNTPLNQIFGTLEPQDYNGFTAFVYTIYTDFFCAVLAVFEHWYREKDLNEEEVKKIDSKLIYWLPPYDLSCKMRVMCFEKYLSDHWKEDLQRMLLSDNVHNLFSDHDTEGCCDNFAKDKNIFRVFQISDRMEIMQAIYGEMAGIQEDETNKHMCTMTEVCVKEICRLKPQVVFCTHHKKCFVRISHAENCSEPFMCKGDSPCILTCETELKKKEQVKRNEFWKTVSAETFPAKKKKRDVATVAESFDREIQTYLHIRDVELDFPLSMLKQSYYQYMAEMHNFDFNPRKTECLNRLRKKLSEKNPAELHLNASLLREPEFHENLFADATSKLLRMQDNFCLSNGHFNGLNCDGKCFSQAINSVAIGSCNPFGRVISLSRSSFTIPAGVNCPEEKDCSKSSNVKATSSKKSEVKKNKIIDKETDNKSCDNSIANNSSSKGKSTNKKNSTNETNNKEKNINSISSDGSNEGKCLKKDNSINGSNSKGKNVNKDNSVNDSNSKGKNANKDNSVNDSSKGKKSKKDNLATNSSNKGENANKDCSLTGSSSKKSKVNKDNFLANNPPSEKNNDVKNNSATNVSKKNKDSSVTSDSKRKGNNGNKNSKCADKILEDEIFSTNVEGEECSEINIDDDVDEILKLIGLGEDDSENTGEAFGENRDIGNNASETATSKVDDKAVENFFKLIGMKDDTTPSKIDISNKTENSYEKMNLKTCACCKKKETRKKMFKKCSKCKEDNFPIQHYYCSPQCFTEDWTESHEEEHVRFSKHSS